MLKVLHICSGDFYGGIEEVCRLIVSEQLKNNYYAEIVYFQKDFKPKIEIGDKILLKLNYLYKYIQLQRLKKFDILHNHSGGLIIDIINLFIFSKSRSFSHNHGCRIRVYKLNKESKSSNFIKQLLAKLIYKKIPRISASKFIFDLQKKYENTKSKNNILLNNPINISEFNSYKILDNNKYHLGYLGRIVEDKGLKSLISFGVYQKQNKLSNKILINGPGEFSEELRNMINHNSLEEIITFENSYVKKSDFFEKIEIFISFSSFESFGLTLYEAIFLGKPIITLQKESIDEKLHQFVWCLNNDSPEEILRAITEIKLKLNELSRKKNQVQNYLADNYSIENYYEKLDAIYRG